MPARERRIVGPLAGGMIVKYLKGTSIIFFTYWAGKRRRQFDLGESLPLA
jgi:hypothetical protein